MGLRSGYAVAMFVFLYYMNPLFAPLSVFFLSFLNLLYFKIYNRLNVLALAPVPVLSGISQDEIPSSPVLVQPCPVLVLLLPSLTRLSCTSACLPYYIRHSGRTHIITPTILLSGV